MGKTVLTCTIDDFTARIYEAGRDERGLPFTSIELLNKEGQSIHMDQQRAEHLAFDLTCLSSVVREMAEEHERRQKQEPEPGMKQSL